MKLIMQIFDCDYIMLNGRPLIRLFGKTETGETVCAVFKNFMPYCYIDTTESKEEIQEVLKGFGVSIEERKKILPIGYRLPKQVFKIIENDPGKIPEIKEKLKNHGTVYEADILFKYRFMVDYGLWGMSWIEVEGTEDFTKTVKCRTMEAKKTKPLEKEKNAPLKYMSFDIECISENENRIPEAESDPIIMVSMAFYPEFKQKNTTVIVTKPTRADDVIVCADEKEMLEKFNDIVSSFDPDIIIGYNINNFDLPYLTKRMEVLNVPKTFGRSSKQVMCRKLQNSYMCSVSGRVVVDPYEIIKRDPWVKFKRYDLGTISEAMLGRTKIDVHGIREMRELWNGDSEKLKRFVDYSRVDSELALALVIEKNLIDKFFELSKISGLLFQDSLGGQSQRHECRLLHEFKKRNMLMPCKPEVRDMIRFKEKREESGLKGAIVLEPQTGLYKDKCVIVLDFTSLYPSIIRTFNICTSTLLLDGEAEHFTTPQGIKFVKHEVREGVLPAVLKDLMEARASVKKRMKNTEGDEKRVLNAKQLALKDMANSVHPETDIVVRNSKGEIIVTEIEKLFDKLTQTHEIKQINKDIEAIELEKWEALSVDGNKSCFKPLYAITRHKNKRKLIKLRTKMGEVIITPDHSIIEMKGKILKEIRGIDITKNTIIAHIKKEGRGRYGDLFGQPPIDIEYVEPSDYVYDLSVRGTEKFVTAQGLVLHNSLYGYTGYVRARLYVMDVANSVTSYGRENILKTQKMVEDNFPVKVVYGDTDSLFVETDTNDMKKAEELGIKISEFISGNLTGVLELKFEKTYKAFLILTKKRYAGWKFEDGEDKIEMKGIETVRRDWCSLTGETMMEVLNIILKEGDIVKASKYVREVIKKLSSGKIPLEKLSIVKGITKALDRYDGVQPHVELAKKMNSRDATRNVAVGERLAYVIIKGNQLLSKRAEDPDYVKEKGLEIDPQYYIENQLLPPIERIFTACGVDKSELLEGSKQKKLFDVFAKPKPPQETILKGFDRVSCTKCKWSFRRLPLRGNCPDCGGNLIFEKDGFAGSVVEM